MVFSKEVRFWSKIYDSWKVTLLNCYPFS